MPLPCLMDETTPTQQDSSRWRSIWILIGGSLAFLLIAVLWKLRQEQESKISPVPAPQPLKPPVSAVRTPFPVAEPESTATPAAEPEPEPEPVTASPPKPDNLKKIKGIGPKISQALNEEGIYTFEQLAETDVEYLHRLMAEREWQMTSPDTWPTQARHLADEKRKKQQGAS